MQHALKESSLNDILHKQTRRKVLVAGIYLVDKENLIPQITRELTNTSNWSLEQRWGALGKGRPNSDLAPFTTQVIDTPAPKFLLLNQLLKAIDLHDFEYVLISDDDIRLPIGFLDHYLELVSRYDFAIAQPARSHDSYIDHWFVEQLDGIDARQTQFVEIGPFFSLHRSVFDYFLPFDETSPMGWGNDFVWPILAEKHNFKMGIIDAVPVAHNLRKPVAYYDYEANKNAMNKYLSERSHLSKEDAFFILESYVS